MRRFRFAFVAIAAAILFYQLILPPVLAFANNGDFPKIIGRFSLVPRVGQRPWADTVYYFDPQKLWVSEYHSTESLLMLPALALGRLLSKDGSFDIRFIGAVHSAVFLLALWLLAPLLAEMQRWKRWLLCAFILFVYTDVMYVIGLNSFYMDEAAYVFLLLSTVLFLRLLRSHSRSDAVLLAISLFFMAGSKTQHAFLGFWFAGLLVFGRETLLPRRGRYVTAIAVCVVTTAAFMLVKGSAKQYSADATYNVVFSRLLPRSKDVGRTLAELGLDDSYRRYIGMHCFLPESGMSDEKFVSAFRNRVPLSAIGRYYLRHPNQMYRDLRASLSEAGKHRIIFGNFDRSTGYPGYSQSRAFALWSDFKTYCFEGHGPRYVFAFLINATLLCGLGYVRRNRLPAGTLPAVLVLTGMAFTELMVSSLGDALEIPRHHFIFFALYDMMLIALLSISLGAGAGRFLAHRHKTAVHPAVHATGTPLA
jgi:hypothetical protein